MTFEIVNKPAFTVIGSVKTIKNEDGYKECPQFWSDHFSTGKGEYIMGMYGICFDENVQEGFFQYMIADDYDPQKELPEEFEKVVIPENTWAVFSCTGAMPDSIQNLNSKIFEEWFPQNKDYEIAGMYNIEYYSDASDYPKGTLDENYYCEIWVPVKAKA